MVSDLIQEIISNLGTTLSCFYAGDFEVTHWPSKGIIVVVRSYGQQVDFVRMTEQLLLSSPLNADFCREVIRNMQGVEEW